MAYKSWIIALAVALWLYLLLPHTATLFYELYHLTGIGFLYWGYSGLKAGSYYFGNWEYQAAACAVVALAIGGLPMLVRALRGGGQPA